MGIPGSDCPAGHRYGKRKLRMGGLFFTSILGVVLVVSGASVLLIEMDNRDQRICLIAYVLQYIGVVLLFVRIFSIQIILSFFLPGLMGAAILGTDQVNLRDRITFGPIFTSARIFRFLMAVIISILIFSIEPKFAVWIPIPDSILFCSLFLIVMGLFTFGLSPLLLNRFLGILNLFLGFQIVYMLLEESILVLGFLTAINLLISLLGAYLVSTQSTEPLPEESEEGDSE